MLRGRTSHILTEEFKFRMGLNFVAKTCVYNYLKPLTNLINKSIIEGIFPEELKPARVVPIQIVNYRPISVLTFFSKVLEKIMYNCILTFMDDNHVFY